MNLKRILTVMGALVIVALLGFLQQPVVHAQERGIDGYTFQANPGCEVKIVIDTGKIKNPINYRLTFNGAALPTEGTLDADGIAELLLPVSRQWYNLTVERAEVDKELYEVESSQGCDGSFARGILAPAPILTEGDWTAAQEKLARFMRLIFDS